MLRFSKASNVLICTITAMSLMETRSRAQEKPVVIHVDWSSTEPLRTTPTLQMVVNPLLMRDSPIHNAAFAALKDLGTDYARLAFWHPYPKLAVAELNPPTSTGTSWDFSRIDPLVKDFSDATGGHSIIFSMSTIPAWMFETEKQVSYPEDPHKLTWDYIKGKELQQDSGRLLPARSGVVRTGRIYR